MKDVYTYYYVSCELRDGTSEVWKVLGSDYDRLQIGSTYIVYIYGNGYIDDYTEVR